MSPYFSGASTVIKAELFFLDPRFRKDDGRRCAAGGGFFHGGGGRSSYVMPDPVITFCLFFKKKGLTNPKKGIIKNM